MDIIVNKVFDTLKFAYFMSIKYNYPLSYMNAIIESINKHGPIKFYNLLECEIRYLQRNPLEYGKYFIAINKPICNLKIINMEKAKSIPPYLDNERESKPNNLKKHQFKPFDKVLVRNTEKQIWKPNFYSFEGYNSSGYVCTNDMKYAQCIPYNEQTAHLLGTCKPYEEPEPKVWKVTCHKNNKVFHFTNDELKHFLENAVINRKDIQWFTTTYEGNNN